MITHHMSVTVCFPPSIEVWFEVSRAVIFSSNLSVKTFRFKVSSRTEQTVSQADEKLYLSCLLRAISLGGFKASHLLQVRVTAEGTCQGKKKTTKKQLLYIWMNGCCGLEFKGFCFVFVFYLYLICHVKSINRSTNFRSKSFLLFGFILGIRGWFLKSDLHLVIL